MRNLIKQFVKYPFFANIIIVIFVLGGIMGLNGMRKSFFPQRTPRNITIMVSYPGASPKEMEEGITQRVEEAIRGLVGLKEINSTSSENFSQVVITTTGEYDLDETLMEVKNAVDGINSFPVSAERPVVYKQRAMTQAMYLGLAGHTDLMTLKDVANTIEDDLRASGIVTQINVSGYPPLEISIEVTEENLLRYNLSFDLISQAVSLNNADISAGMIKSDEEEILIRSRARSISPDDIGSIILRANDDGSFIRIRDIANIKMKFADVSSDFKINKMNGISFSVNKLNEEDLEKISEFCKKYVEEFNIKHFESDMKLYITFDFLQMLKSRLDLLYSNGGLGFLMVIIALALFMNFRLSFWVAAGIPFSFLAMFIAANLFGITINMISLFGMLLVIGILVDDGIVIGENIFTHFEMGKSPGRAAIDGTMEVLPAVLTSVLTTMIAFIPLLLIEGQMEFLADVAFVVIFSLGFSLIEAFFVLPAHLGTRHVLRRERFKKQEVGKFNVRKSIDKFINYMRFRLYGKVLRWTIRWRWIAVTLPLAIILITVGFLSGGFIRATFFPSIPFDSFLVNIAFKPGAGEKQTAEYVKKFEEIVWQVNNEISVEDSVPYISYTFSSVGSSFDGQETGSHAGTVRVFLNDIEGRKLSSIQVSNLVRERIGETPELDKISVGGSNRWGSPVSISLLGKNGEELRQAKEYLKGELKKLPDLMNITDNNAAGKQEVRLKLTPKAYYLGLNHASISKQIRQGFYGGQSQRLQKGKDEIRVWVRFPKQDRLTLGQLENMKIKTPVGDFPLSELATYKIERGPVSIKRYNTMQEIRVNADLIDQFGDVPPILEKVNTEIIPALQASYPGVRILHQGQQRNSEEAASDMIKYYSIAFLIIILILVIHFRSASQAIIVMMMIPLAWAGAILGHGVEGIPVSMLSSWGMVALSGVIINDAVVFLAKYNSLLSEGQRVEDAAYSAGIARFRAIVLTTITTTIGLYPIILEKSFQAQFLKPMAASLAYGVFIGTAFILLFFPSLILVLNDIKVHIKWLWTGKRPVSESVETVIIDQKRTID